MKIEQSHARGSRIKREEQGRVGRTTVNVGATIPAFRHPLEDFFRPLLRLGFILIDFVETKPTEECKQAHPRSYEQMMKRPTIMVAKWQRPN